MSKPCHWLRHQIFRNPVCDRYWNRLRKGTVSNLPNPPGRQVLYASLSRAMVIHITFPRDPAQKASSAERSGTASQRRAGAMSAVAFRRGLRSDLWGPAVAGAAAAACRNPSATRPLLVRLFAVDTVFWAVDRQPMPSLQVTALDGANARALRRAPELPRGCHECLTDHIRNFVETPDRACRPPVWFGTTPLISRERLENCEHQSVRRR